MHSEKLGIAVRRFLADFDSVGGSLAPAPVEVLIRVKGEPDDRQREQLVSAGASVRTVAGEVLTASLAAADIGPVTDLDHVVYVELAQPLFPEPGR
ncbi:hypothetical protein [Actinomadura sp. NTSP31]|uniref:hypothetical protein n=1 Tax=Actinomadura sp. NTSP31 TaxID=1735447 RepID=UPI0035C16A95